MMSARADGERSWRAVPWHVIVVLLHAGGEVEDFECLVGKASAEGMPLCERFVAGLGSGERGVGWGVGGASGGCCAR